MKCYREITISSSTYDANNLARYVEQFAEQSPYWGYSPKESFLYEKNIGHPSCSIVTNVDSLKLAAMHFTKKGDHSLYMTNIIPLSIGELNVEEYNAIVEYFAKSIRKHAKNSALALKISLSKSEIKLYDIVTGKISNRLLKAYLAMNPRSYHPLDIERLDKFICSLSRYSRTHIDLDAFQALLMEELGWSSIDAKWCRTRVEIGLEVLAVNKRF